MRVYDHEEDTQELTFTQHKLAVRQQFEDDYNFSKFTSEINELNFQAKSHDSLIKKMQRQIDASVTESRLTQTIAFINAGIYPDPNMIKLLKTKEDDNEDEGDKIKMNASLFAKKLNQMSESLSVLLGGLKRLQNKITSVEGELGVQLNEKFASLQLQLEQVRGETNKQSMEAAQKMELFSFELSDKIRDLDTKVNWKLNEFKGKIDEKINQQMVLIYLDNSEKKVDKSMRQFQIKSNIDPERIDRMQEQINANRLTAQDKITECNYTLRNIKQEINNNLIKLQEYSSNKINIEKRLNLFNQNFMDVYKRVIKCESQEVVMKQNISKLLSDDQYVLQQLKRVNTVLLNLKISDDFQRMLEEMNPTKVLELQDTVNGVKQEQNSIFGEIAIAKRQIAIISAKSQNMGFLMPNREKDKMKKQEIYEALDSFLKENQFAQKISNIDKQVTDYKNSMDSVVTLSRQVARLQKQSDYQRLSFEMKNLEQYFKKQLTLLNNRLKQKYTSPLQFKERPGTNSRYSINSQSMILKQGSGRTFSTKKIQQINGLNISKQSNKNFQIIQMKTSKNR